MGKLLSFSATFYVIAVFCAPAFGDTVPACVQQPLSAYLTLTGGCEISDKVFYRFGYGTNTKGAGVAMPASGITVTPLTNDPSDPGFDFQADWTISGAGSADSLIFYDVSTLSGLPLINDESLTWAASTNNTGGSGVASLDEFLCLSGEVGNCQVPIVHFGLRQSPVPSPQVDHVTFDPVNHVSMLKDVFVFATGTAGATITDVTNRTSEVPEPGSVILLGSCLLVVALLGSRTARPHASR
jgi:hypothetical protein